MTQLTHTNTPRAIGEVLPGVKIHLCSLHVLRHLQHWCTLERFALSSEVIRLLKTVLFSALIDCETIDQWDTTLAAFYGY